MSLAVLKKKTHNGNPRIAPISGSNNGNFGFSLNGTRRGNYINKDPNIAAKGINCFIESNNSVNSLYDNHISAPAKISCTNDINVVKKTVMNTKGLLAKKLKGFNHTIDSDCKGNGPLTLNWVKNSSVSDYSQSNYIKNVVSVNGNKLDASGCNLFKSYNGIIGILDKNGFDAISKLPQGCNPSSQLSLDEMNKLIKSKSIMPNQSLCAQLNHPSLTKSNCTTSKPGLTTIDAGDYIKRKLLINKNLPYQLQNTKCNYPQPNINLNKKCNKTDYDLKWNNNKIASDQIYFDYYSNAWIFKN